MIHVGLAPWAEDGGASRPLNSTYHTDRGHAERDLSAPVLAATVYWRAGGVGVELPGQFGLKAGGGRSLVVRHPERVPTRVRDAIMAHLLGSRK